MFSQQEWAPIGAKWYYDYLFVKPYTSYYTIESIKDTMIQDITYKVLEISISTYSEPAKITGHEYTFMNHDTVFVYKYGKPNLLYDFNAKTSDIWKVPGSFLCKNDSFGMIKIIKSGKIKIFGDSLKYIIVSADENSSYGFTSDTIYEKIGSLGYILPDPNSNCGILDAGSGCLLRCYSDPNWGVYKAKNYKCDSLITVNKYTEIPGNSLIEIRYLSELKEIEVLFNEQTASYNTTIKIFNCFGQLIMNKQLKNNPENIKIDNSYLPGIFLFQISIKNVLINQKKYLY